MTNIVKFKMGKARVKVSINLTITTLGWFNSISQWNLMILETKSINFRVRHKVLKSERSCQIGQKKSFYRWKPFQIHQTECKWVFLSIKDLKVLQWARVAPHVGTCLAYSRVPTSYEASQRQVDRRGQQLGTAELYNSWCAALQCCLMGWPTAPASRSTWRNPTIQ